MVRQVPSNKKWGTNNNTSGTSSPSLSNSINDFATKLHTIHQTTEETMQLNNTNAKVSTKLMHIQTRVNVGLQCLTKINIALHELSSQTQIASDTMEQIQLDVNDAIQEQKESSYSGSVAGSVEGEDPRQVLQDLIASRSQCLTGSPTAYVTWLEAELGITTIADLQECVNECINDGDGNIDVLARGSDGHAWIKPGMKGAFRRFVLSSCARSNSTEGDKKKMTDVDTQDETTRGAPLDASHSQIKPSSAAAKVNHRDEKKKGKRLTKQSDVVNDAAATKVKEDERRVLAIQAQQQAALDKLADAKQRHEEDKLKQEQVKIVPRNTKAETNQERDMKKLVYPPPPGFGNVEEENDKQRAKEEERWMAIQADVEQTRAAAKQRKQQEEQTRKASADRLEQEKELKKRASEEKKLKRKEEREAKAKQKEEERQKAKAEKQRQLDAMKQATISSTTSRFTQPKAKKATVTLSIGNSPPISTNKKSAALASIENLNLNRHKVKGQPKKVTSNVTKPHRKEEFVLKNTRLAKYMKSSPEETSSSIYVSPIFALLHNMNTLEKGRKLLQLECQIKEGLIIDQRLTEEKKELEKKLKKFTDEEEKFAKVGSSNPVLTILSHMHFVHTLYLTHEHTMPFHQHLLRNGLKSQKI